MSYLAKLINQLLYFTYFFVFIYHRIKNLYLLRSNKVDLNDNKNNKLIIRNDRLGDSILTIPFILGIKKNQKTILISTYIFTLLDQLKIDNNNLISLEKANSRKVTYGINLPGYNLNNIKKFKELKNSNIFTQVGFRNYKNKGLPLFFTPNFGSRISQSQYIKNSFDFLKIEHSSIDGIKILNNKIDLILKEKKIKNSSNIVLVFMGMGIDNGRRISLKTLLKIKEYCLFNNLKLCIISEPGFENFFKDLKKSHNLELLKNQNLGELCLAFRNAKLVIGYDSGPMHLATLCTQTLLFFSHTSIKQWGINIWHKKLKSDKLRFNSINYILLKNKNLGSHKNNWIYYKNEIRCPVHSDKRFQNLFSSKNCCDLRLENIKEILQKIDI